MSASDAFQVPARMRGRYEEIASLAESAAREHLNEEYAAMSRRMAAALARERPSPLERGEARTWAAGILRAVGFVNFLGDPAQEPRMTAAELAERTGVGQSTLSAKLRQIRDALDLRQLDPDWTLPSMVENNPFIWIVLVDGIPVDVRMEPRALQEQAFRQGLIPYVPADGPPAEGAGGGAAAEAPHGALHAVPVTAGESEPKTAGDRVFQLKITLDDVRPPVWRRVLVPENLTLEQLHRVIQVAMGWEDYHLWRFQAGGTEFGENLGGGWGPPVRSAKRARLGEVAGPGDVLLYEYDFGDSWEHRVRVEKVLAAEPGRQYPVCTAGARACPPEDCGGSWGYERLLEALGDPTHPEHAELLEWVGGAFDPEEFDPSGVNGRLAGIRPRGGGAKGRTPPPTDESTGGSEDEDATSLFRQAEAAMREMFAQAETALEQALEENPDIDIDELNQVLRTVSGDYNAWPQAELGGFSPTHVQQLIDADWESPDSVVQLEDSLPPSELEGSSYLHNARLFLRLLGEQEEVKATPKGNVARSFVSAFREQMRWYSRFDEEWYADRKVLNEDDVSPLRWTRILLDVGGLIKRRKGAFSLTRQGRKLADDAHVGELFATLFRTYFRRFNLAYVDGVGPVWGFQDTVAVALRRFATAGGDWKAPRTIGEEILLPPVLQEVPADRGVDSLAIVMQTRILRPLQGFGLAESQESPREPGTWGDGMLFRKTPLFDRFLSFGV